jgi:hypothetical protein
MYIGQVFFKKEIYLSGFNFESIEVTRDAKKESFSTKELLAMQESCTGCCSIELKKNLSQQIFIQYLL